MDNEVFEGDLEYGLVYDGSKIKDCTLMRHVDYDFVVDLDKK